MSRSANRPETRVHPNYGKKCTETLVWQVRELLDGHEKVRIFAGGTSVAVVGHPGNIWEPEEGREAAVQEPSGRMRWVRPEYVGEIVAE